MKSTRAQRGVSGCLLCTLLCGARWAGAALSFPPQLPGGVASVRERSERFLLRPKALQAGVQIAKEPPAVDFLFYPCQTYPGNPWSNWGDGLCVGTRYYSSVGDHGAPEGNAFLYEYDSEKRTLRLLVDVRALLGLPPGHYTPGKIHGRIDQGSDTWLYFATHRGSTRVTTPQYHYKGDWILRVDPRSGRAEVVVHAPVPMQCVPASVLDPQRMIFYGGTAAGDRRDRRIMFFAYEVRAHLLLYSCYGGPYRYLIFAASSGKVYFTPRDDVPLRCFDPEKKSVRILSVRCGLRAATQETPQGLVYTVGRDGSLWAFDTAREKARFLGSASVGAQKYITSIDADPGGRYLYYVPGAHGGAEREGSPVVQYDTKTKKKKVIAFLSPFFREKYGYTPMGTFSTALSPDGSVLFVTWNGNRGGADRRGRLRFDTCALTAIHIPRSER